MNNPAVTVHLLVFFFSMWFQRFLYNISKQWATFLSEHENDYVGFTARRQDLTLNQLSSLGDCLGSFIASHNMDGSASAYWVLPSICERRIQKMQKKKLQKVRTVFIQIYMWCTRVGSCGASAWLVQRLPSDWLRVHAPTISDFSHSGACSLCLFGHQR